MIPFENVMDSFTKNIFTQNSYFEDQMDDVLYIEDNGVAVMTNVSPPPDVEGFTVGSIKIHVDEISLGLMRVQSGQNYLLIRCGIFTDMKKS